MIGDRAGTRTQDLQIKSPLLYQLSYAISGPLRPPCTANQPTNPRQTKQANRNSVQMLRQPYAGLKTTLPRRVRVEYPPGAVRSIAASWPRELPPDHGSC